MYPNKKMTIEQHIVLMEKLLNKKKYKIALLGGPEDKERNEDIYANFKGKIINTPTNDGIRKGACYEDIADILDCPMGTVRSRIFRARDAIDEQIRPLLET